MCVYVCTYVRLYLCTYVCVCMCVRMYVCTIVRLYMHECVYIYISMYQLVGISKYICVYLCMHVLITYYCIYTCIYMNVCYVCIKALSKAHFIAAQVHCKTLATMICSIREEHVDDFSNNQPSSRVALYRSLEALLRGKRSHCIEQGLNAR